MLPSAMGFPGSCDGRHRHRFNVLDDLAVASDGIIKDAEGFDVPRDRELMEAVFPEEETYLGFLARLVQSLVNWSRMDTHQQKM